MAQKDIALGWGDLPRRLTVWRCPSCAVESTVEAWAIVWGEVNGVKCDGRKCPSEGCAFAAYQHHETVKMDPTPRVAPVEPPPAPKKSHRARKHG